MTGILASLVTIAIHSSTDFNMHINANAVAASILIGLALGLAGRRRTIKPGIGGRALALLIILPLIAASLFSIRLLSADRAMPLREDFVRGPVPTAITPDQLPALRKAIQSMPLEPSYQVLLCKRLTEDRNYDEAREACDRALWLAPHAQRALVARAELDAPSAGFRAAEGTFELALGVTPYNPVALDAHANLILEHTNSFSADDRPRKIREALDMLDLALKISPPLVRSIPFQLRRARAYFELDDPAAASAIIRQIPEISQATLPYKIAEARYALISGNVGRGLNLYETLLSTKALGDGGMNQVINAIWDDAERLPESFHVQLLAGRALLNSGNRTHALRFARAAVKLRPVDKRSLTLLAECAEATGDVHGAISAYETIVNRDPDDVEARREISRLLRKSMGMAR
jgi:tetratricopeptide (TPR) repeat protein